MDLGSIQTGKTVDYDYYEKENPSDFTLLKRCSLAELKAGIYWPSPWGNVRPGWHVECATMATGHLGQPVDIHLASMDLIFPHGDNEIAIAEGLTAKPLANMWLHSEVVMAGGRKVARPGGADVTLRDLLAEGHHPRTIRYWLLSQHFDRVLTYSPENLARADKTVAKINGFVERLAFAKPGLKADDLDQLLYEVRSRMQQAMDHNFNLPQAMGHLQAFIKKINRLLSRGLMEAEQIARVLRFMNRVDEVLAILDHKEPAAAADQEIAHLVAEREKARQAKDFSKADAIRSQLEARGVVVSDTPAGPRWHLA
jgi:cysteinyl-tRNA synthetase